jgi:hypothetical protein
MLDTGWQITEKACSRREARVATPLSFEYRSIRHPVSVIGHRVMRITIEYCTM